MLVPTTILALQQTMRRRINCTGKNERAPFCTGMRAWQHLYLVIKTSISFNLLNLWSGLVEEKTAEGGWWEQEEGRWLWLIMNVTYQDVRHKIIVESKTERSKSLGLQEDMLSHHHSCLDSKKMNNSDVTYNRIELE